MSEKLSLPERLRTFINPDYAVPRPKVDALMHEAADALEAMQAVVAAGQAVVDRWDTPSWKDAPHTGLSINMLRRAIERAVRCDK